MKDEIKLTKLAKCAGCGAKVGAGILAQLLGDIRVHSDPNLLVGFDKSDRLQGLGRACTRADRRFLPAHRR